MRQSQYQSSIRTEIACLQLQSLEAEHRLEGARRHLAALAAEPSLSAGVGGLPAILVTLMFAATFLLFL
jgi:hypothetical protein